jgi:hypothetical protein
MNILIERIARDTRYLLVGLPVAAVSFVLLLTGLVVGVTTTILVIPGSMFGTLQLARLFADADRRALSDVLGRPMPAMSYRPPPHDASWFRRLWYPAGQLRYWLDLIHGIVVFPLAIVGFVVAVVWWAVALYGLAYPLFGWALYRIPNYQALPGVLDLGNGLGVSIMFHLALGVVATLTLPLALRAATLTRAGLALALLATPTHRQLSPAELPSPTPSEPSPAADPGTPPPPGFQPRQRLAGLAMDLAQVRRLMDRDPEIRNAPVSQGIARIRDELRSMAQGSAPLLLVDHGLGAAFAALAARARIPVEFDIATEERYPAAVERMAYYVVAESLANVAEHGQATRVVVSLYEREAVLVVLVADNGVGSVSRSVEGGLAVLADRLGVVGGDLIVQSPAGGPTLVGAQIPCG